MLEGLHPLKHALRFGATVEAAWTPDPGALAELTRALAPDVADVVAALARPVDPATWSSLAPRAVPSPVVAVARRPPADPAAVLAAAGPEPVVLLDHPTHHGNVGAVVRVAAAAGAAGVLTTGATDPWSASAVRGAAGLQFAVPTVRLDAVPATDRPLVAVDPEGEPFDEAPLPARALLAFGSERHGLGPDVLGRADARVRIPMRAGVSSLNLATAVAVVLYASVRPPPGRTL